MPQGGYIWDEGAWLGWSDTRSCSTAQYSEHPSIPLAAAQCTDAVQKPACKAMAWPWPGSEPKPCRKNIYKSSAPADVFMGEQPAP